ncbi:uncharacterized protein LOC123540679 [Mercenaria mercenaria]|uniref:uncharacterized protein LOC123540679 n=1 Tax=Mercenaria mercenaria TaxID=6596 RepID=UPI00234E6071|nr:uncharacterized protein LOC123540679 [Mercenaria mercenaria]
MAAKRFGFAKGLTSFMLLCVQLCKGQVPDNVDGGADGVNGNQFLTGSPNTEKIILGLNCIKDTTDSTEVKFEMYVYQSDDAFKFNPASTTVRQSELVTYEKCYFIDAALFDTTQNVKAANAHANCGNSVDFSPLETPTSSSTDYEKRTKKATLSVPNPAQSVQYQCGARKVGNEIEVAVYCKRDVDYDKDFDIVFIARHGTDGCTATSVSPDKAKIADPNTVSVKYNIEVTMKAYKHTDIGTVVNGPESPSANEITAATPLGTATYLEVCAKIPQVTTATANDINNQFFENGISPMAFMPHSCTAAADIANQDFQANIEAKTVWANLNDAFGCGAAGTGAAADKGLAEYFASDVFIFKYAETTPAVANSHLMSPNCVRSITFPLVSYARLKAADIVDTIFTCKLDPCTSGGDNKCFADKAGGSNNYPTCPPPSGRKRRETIKVGPEIPSEVSVRVKVMMPGANRTSTDKFDGCFEKKTFIGLTSGLVALLTAVLIAAIFLSVKLSTSPPESSTDSMTGIQNKGYY